MRVKLLPLMLPLAAAWIAQPVSAPANAQDGTACANEAQRLAEGIPLSGSPTAIGAQQPGSRIDAGMTGDQQSQARNLMQQARAAGQQGDAATCMQRLSEARTMLRQGGIGPRPGSSNPTISRDQNAGDASPNLQGDQPAPQERGAARGTLGGTTSGDGGPGLPSSARDSLPDSITTPQGAEAPRTAAPPRRDTRPSAVGADSGSSGARGTTTTPGATSSGTRGGTSSGGSSGGGGR